MPQSLEEKLSILREAIKQTKQVIGFGRNLPREFCPHILGHKRSDWHVHVWQFDGQSEHGPIPGWRCFDINDLDQLKIQDGDWQRGHTKGLRSQTCVDKIDTVINSAFAAEIRNI